MNTITKRVVELTETLKGDVSKIRASLILEDYKAKDIDVAIKEAGLKKKVVSFASEYYAWLAEDARSVEDARFYIMGEDGCEPTSKNVKAHLSHYLNIAQLAIDVRVATATNK
jgi:hypothetical protein